MHGRKVELETAILFKPFADLFTVVGGDVVQDDVNSGDGLGDLTIQIFEKGNKLLLSFAFETSAIGHAASGIKGSEELQRSFAFVFVLHEIGEVSRLGGLCPMQPAAGLERSLLVHRQNNLMWKKWPSIEVNHLVDPLVKLRISRPFRMQPHMISPRFEFMIRQDAIYSRGRYLVDDPVGHQLPSQFGAVPLG